MIREEDDLNSEGNERRERSKKVEEDSKRTSCIPPYCIEKAQSILMTKLLLISLNILGRFNVSIMSNSIIDYLYAMTVVR